MEAGATGQAKLVIESPPKLHDQATNLPVDEKKVPDSTAPPTTCGTIKQKGIDRRPFVIAMIRGVPLRALVDTGATRSYLGPVACKKLSPRKELTPDQPAPPMVMANGEVQEIPGEIRLPMKVYNTEKEIMFRIAPTLAYEAILGMDALAAYGEALHQVILDHIERMGDPTTPQGTATAATLHDPSSFATPIYADELPKKSRATRFEWPLAEDQVAGIADLDDAQRRKVDALVQEIFGKPGEERKLGLTTRIKHKMDVQGHAPIRQRVRQYSPKVLEHMHAEVDKLLAAGIIEESTSEWSNPVVMVRKPNNEYRMCIDFRRVNDLTRKDPYPMKDMAGILSMLRSAKFISTIDLSQAYHQVPLDEESKPITAFAVPGKGLYQYVRMPYGPCGAPATFQRLQDSLIGPDLVPYAYSYLDDIILVSETFEEHLALLRLILERLAAAGLTINPEKCHFCVPEVKYLGFVVNENGLHIDPDKVSPVLQFPAPKNISQLRRFIGMTSWYRRFVESYADVAEPLTRLLRTSQRWNWGPEQQTAFDGLKYALATAPVLIFPNFNERFKLQTDASGFGIGAVLTQTVDGEEKVVSFASRTLTDAEKGWTVTERECLAVIWAIRKFRCYLEGYSFTVVTDHSSLQWLRNLKETTGGRLTRWALEVQSYDFDVVHRKGALHKVPDALSRMYEDEQGLLAAVESSSDEWYHRRVKAVQENPATLPNWKLDDGHLYCHRPDPLLDSILEDLDAWKLVPPSEMHQQIISAAHDPPVAGHLGVDKTYARVSREFYWPGCYKDVGDYVRRCPICQAVKPSQKGPAGLMGRKIIEAPWQIVSSDIMGPLPLTSDHFQYIIVFQCLLTKWVELKALRRANAQSVCSSFLSRVVYRFGCPRVLLTDNGTEYSNHEVDSLLDELGVHHFSSPPYHPQSNPTERVNRVIKQMIISYVDQEHKSWKDHLPELQYAINSAKHDSTKFSPVLLTLGYEYPPLHGLRPDLGPSPDVDNITTGSAGLWQQRMLRLSGLRDTAVRHLEEAGERQAHYYDEGRREVRLSEGEKVWVRNHQLSKAVEGRTSRLVKKYDGPYVVSKVLSPIVYEITDATGRIIGRHHVSDLKTHYEQELISDFDSTGTEKDPEQDGPEIGPSDQQAPAGRTPNRHAAQPQPPQPKRRRGRPRKVPFAGGVGTGGSSGQVLDGRGSLPKPPAPSIRRQVIFSPGPREGPVLRSARAGTASRPKRQ